MIHFTLKNDRSVKIEAEIEDFEEFAIAINAILRTSGEFAQAHDLNPDEMQEAVMSLAWDLLDDSAIDTSKTRIQLNPEES